MKRPRKLTAKEREAVWAPPESNAGVGWWPATSPQDPRRELERDIAFDKAGNTKPLDFDK